MWSSEWGPISTQSVVRVSPWRRPLSDRSLDNSPVASGLVTAHADVDLGCSGGEKSSSLTSVSGALRMVER